MPARVLTPRSVPLTTWWPLVLGCLVAVFFWFLDAFIESEVLAQGTFARCMLRPDLDDLVTRIVAALCIVAFALSTTILRVQAVAAKSGVGMLSRALEASPVLVVITGPDGRIEYVNPKFTQITGYSAAEVMGQNPRLLKSGELPAEAYREMWETILAGREWRGEFHNRRKNGELYWERASISALRDEHGRIAHFVSIKEDITEQKRMQQLLEALSTTDGLTGLANWRCFSERLDEEWKRATRQRAPLSLLMIDIDDFKTFNDAFGHLAGDDCLKQVARTLGDVSRRPGDVAARYGGEEFVILLPTTDAQGARTVADGVHAAVKELGIPHPRSRTASVVTISVGVATTCPSESESPDALLGAADQALYQAKAAGRNRVFVATTREITEALA